MISNNNEENIPDNIRAVENEACETLLPNKSRSTYECTTMPKSEFVIGNYSKV